MATNEDEDFDPEELFEKLNEDDVLDRLGERLEEAAAWSEGEKLPKLHDLCEAAYDLVDALQGKLAEIEHFAQTAECHDCGHRFQATLDDFLAIPDLQERVDPGGKVPAAECPDCGSLAYLVNDASRKRRARTA